jgi:hypothetical protein
VCQGLFKQGDIGYGGRNEGEVGGQGHARGGQTRVRFSWGGGSSAIQEWSNEGQVLWGRVVMAVPGMVKQWGTALKGYGFQKVQHSRDRWAARGHVRGGETSVSLWKEGGSWA